VKIPFHGHVVVISLRYGTPQGCKKFRKNEHTHKHTHTNIFVFTDKIVRMFVGQDESLDN
jgi:hypothetical protein